MAHLVQRSLSFFVVSPPSSRHSCLLLERGERGGLAPWHGCLEKGAEGDRLKQIQGFPFFTCRADSQHTGGSSQGRVNSFTPHGCRYPHRYQHLNLLMQRELVRQSWFGPSTLVRLQLSQFLVQAGSGDSSKCKDCPSGYQRRH